MAEHRRLDAFSLAALLVSAHYGLGFILGTAEQTLSFGVAGSLYPVCLGLGTIAVLLLAKFYWTRVEQIWTLLGKSYGNSVKIGVGLMSWSSLIGIEAVQMISGAFILKVLGMPVLPTMAALAILFILISLLPVEKAGFLFRGLLVVNFLALIWTLWALQGFSEYGRSLLEFIPSLHQVGTSNLVGISLSTILLVLLDMKYQQFLVQAKDIRSLYQGCFLAALCLFLLAFLPSSVVIAAQHHGILPTELSPKEALPFILSWLGGGSDRPLGIALIMSLMIPALGVGSSILRVQTKTILDFNIIPAHQSNKIIVTFVNACLSLAVALKGGDIVNLIVSFYAAYVAAVFVPFFAYLIAQRSNYTFSKTCVKLSLTMSSTSAIALLVTNLINSEFIKFGNIELDIIIVGIIFGVLGLLIGHFIEKNKFESPVSKEA